MKLSKKELTEAIKSNNFDITFSYKGCFGSIVPNYDKGGYHLAYKDSLNGDTDILDVDTFKELWNVKFFSGRSLKEFYDDADFSY